MAVINTHIFGVHPHDNGIFERWILQLFKNENGKSELNRQDKDSSELELFVYLTHTTSKPNEMHLPLRDTTTFLSFQHETKGRQLELDHTHLSFTHLKPLNSVANMLLLHVVGIQITLAVTCLVRSQFQCLVQL